MPCVTGGPYQPLNGCPSLRTMVPDTFFCSMTTVTVSLSDEEMHRLEELSKREGLTVEQMVRLGINDFIGQPDEFFRAAARHVTEKNAELYRRLS